MTPFDPESAKLSFASHAVSADLMRGVLDPTRRPEVGDLALVEVADLGRHQLMEVQDSTNAYIFPGDTLVTVFGNRYAPDQYEGYVPRYAARSCDLLSVGGMSGVVKSQHASMLDPTRLRIRGYVTDRDDRVLNLRDFTLAPMPEQDGGILILVLGTAMNAGKTTTAGTIIRALSRTGAKVAAAKVTGTASGKDLRYMGSSGARTVLDFTSAGYPSTYMIPKRELFRVTDTVLSHLRACEADYMVVEVADGLLQRETRMLLDAPHFREAVDHVFFAAGDSLAAEAGVRRLTEMGLPPLAVSGALTMSALASREAEEATGLPCPTMEQLADGMLLRLLEDARALNDGHVPRYDSVAMLSCG